MTAPTLDLDAFRQRNEQIVRARDQAVKEYKRWGLKEADSEHDYRKEKAAAFATYRHDEKGVTEAEILSEGDVAHHRKARDRAHVLKRSAELRVAELERNAASLRVEASMSERIDGYGS